MRNLMNKSVFSRLMSQKTKTHFIDAKGQILGRLAVKIAVFLRGKNSPDFMPHILCQRKVIVYNSDQLKFSSKKLQQKKYLSHSGYPGSLKEQSLRSLFEKDSPQVLRRAVWGMLPKNRLRSQMIKNLGIYKSALFQKYGKKD